MTTQTTHSILESKAWFDQQDEEGFTPLHRAVIENHLYTVQCLLEKGAKISSELSEYLESQSASINPKILSTLLLKKLDVITEITASSMLREVIEKILNFDENNYNTSNASIPEIKTGIMSIVTRILHMKNDQKQNFVEFLDFYLQNMEQMPQTETTKKNELENKSLHISLQYSL